MRVVVRINGVEKEEAVRIDALPCPTGDPILDSDSVRKAMKDMWDDSNPDSAWSKKVEKGLHVFRHPTTKKVRVKRINDPNANGCTINMFAGIAPSDSGYILEAVIHSHPNKPGDPLNGCSGVAGSGYLGGGGSGWKSGSTKGDWPAAKTLKQDNVRLYSMDYEGNVWWLNPDIPDAQKPNNPNRYPWKGGSCDWYVP